MRKGELSAIIEASKGNFRAALVSGLLVALFGGWLLVFPKAFISLGELLIERSYDIPFKVRDNSFLGAFLQRKTPDEAVIVYLDDDSHVQLQEQGLRTPFLRGWDRAATHAELLKRLTAEGARVVAFDIVFSDDADDKGEDEAFASALRASRRVALAADHAPQTQTGAGDQFMVPNETLLEAVTRRAIDEQVDDMAAVRQHIGSARVFPGSDLAIRMHPTFNAADFIYPLSWVTAGLAGAPVTGRTNAWREFRWINYYGGAGTIPSVPYWRALDTNEIQLGAFKDKAVFIGSGLLTRASGDRKDAYKAVSGTSQITGVEIQATLCLNLLRGEWLARIGNNQQFALVILLGLASGAGLMFFRPPRALSIGIVLVLLLMIAGCSVQWFFQHWFAWLIPASQVGAAALASVAVNSYRLHVQRKLLQQSIAMYVSPAVASAVLEQPDMMKPGARKEMLSIMFTDIAGFTDMSEGMDSDDLAKFMNRYFETAVNECIHPVEGTVVKYIGDAIFAIWNAPLPQPNHRELACKAAICLRDKISNFRATNSGVIIHTRIGLHSGTASVGNFGSSNRVDYTALGENINLTSRMEGLNKYLGTSILATSDIVEPVEHRFTTRYLGQFQLKGFARAVDVHELIGELDRAEESLPLRSHFAAGLDAFKRRDFEAAQEAFRCVLQVEPKDGPSHFYLRQIELLRDAPLEPSWNGEIELKEK